MRDKRDRRKAVHFAGSLRIKRGRETLIIHAGGCACCTIGGHMTQRPGDVTCKRCIHLMKLDGSFSCPA